MSANDLDRNLNDWFDAVEARTVPTQILANVFAVTRRTGQRRAMAGRLAGALRLDQPLRGTGRMERTFLLAGGIAGALVIAMVGFAYLNGGVNVGEPPSPTPSPTVGIESPVPSDPALPEPAVEQLEAIDQLVDAINARDVDGFTADFDPGIFNARGDFQDSSCLFGSCQYVAQRDLVQAWMDIMDAWGLEAGIVECSSVSEAPRWNDWDTIVRCTVATRWHTLSLEVIESWFFHFQGARLAFWDYELLDLNPVQHTLPLGYDGLEAWESWLETNRPELAAQVLNPREAGPTGHVERDFSINGHRFWPDGLIPYDPAFADDIEASIQDYLREVTIGDAVEAINARDVAALRSNFAADGILEFPGVDGRAGREGDVYLHDQPVYEDQSVEGWLSLLDTWGMEARLGSCRTHPESTISCSVRTSWHVLQIEIGEEWTFDFDGARARRLNMMARVDPDPSNRVLPLGLSDLERWATWLRETHPQQADLLLPTGPDLFGHFYFRFYGSPDEIGASIREYVASRP